MIFTNGFLARPDEYRGSLIETHQGQLLQNIEVPIRALLVSGDTLWALGEFDLFEMSLTGEMKGTYNFEPTGNPVWAAQAMALVGDTMVISRGYGGIIGMDLNTHAVKWMNAILDDGIPAGLAHNGNNVYVAMATSRQDGFTGVALLNPANGEILRKTPYNVARSGVISPDAIAAWDNGRFIMNNGGWIHMLTQAQLSSERSARARWVAEVIPAQDPVTRHYMMLKGGLFVENNQVIGCGVYMVHREGNYVHASRLFRVTLP